MRYIETVIKQPVQRRVSRGYESHSVHFARSARRDRTRDTLRATSIELSRKMTPLPRWVLLALLLASARASPEDDACVALCCARSRVPEIVGVCEDQQKLALQFAEGQSPTRGLLRLCLATHSAAADDPLRFEDSEICRSFRESLIASRGCSCDSLGDERTRSPEREVSSRLEGSFEDVEQLKGSEPAGRLLAALMKIVADRALAPDVLGSRRKSTSRLAPGSKMKAAEEGKAEGGSVDAAAENLNTESPMGEAESSTSVDWDLWCIAQCDNGQGGSACDCDIIP